MALVEIRGVVKRFGTNTVLDEIDLTVEEHQVVCLIGASGSGKSTLLRCVNGLEAVQAGEIWTNGRKVIQDDIKLNRLRRDVGIVFQSYNLFPHMTVRREHHPGAAQGARPQQVGRRRARAPLLDRIGLADKAEEYPDRLSGGQQQRVAIVRALAMQPDAHALRRDHERPRPRARQRGARDDARARRTGHDDDRRDPRDGVRRATSRARSATCTRARSSRRARPRRSSRTPTTCGRRSS